MNDLEKIKKNYGEKMMHLCRELFSTLLEQEGLLFYLIESNFAHTKLLYDDIIENHFEEQFKNYIYSFVDVERKQIEVLKSPKELLQEAGYDLFECKTEEDIQKFKKYYAPKEELCTFKEERLNKCHVFFAIKKNVEEIKRENFSNPQRQDEYGTSVISIQFTRGNINTLSIKNRYNHRVNNPDSTFSNNLENIIPGLTRSFEKEYNLNINQNEIPNFELPGYVKAADGKFYKYNYEKFNVYYCPDNIIIDNFEVKKDYQEKEKYIIFDYYVVDLINKQIYLYDKNNILDSFVLAFKKIKKIEIKKDSQIKTLIIHQDDDNVSYIEIDKSNRMTSFRNDTLTEIDPYFLYYNLYLENIELPNTSSIGCDFLYFNNKLKKINIPNLKFLDFDCLFYNKEKRNEIYQIISKNSSQKNTK